jgi:hypothetical protein
LGKAKGWCSTKESRSCCEKDWTPAATYECSSTKEIEQVNESKMGGKEKGVDRLGLRSVTRTALR